MAAKTTLRVQDYNLPVLKLVTLPNLILAALPYLPPESLRSPEDAGDLSSAIPDLEQPGDLSITPSLKTAFKALLEEKGVELTFSYGNWTGLARDLKDAEEGYGLVMTAETIYAEDSVDSLIDVLRAPSSRPKGVGSGKEEVVLEEGMEKLYVRDEWAKRPLREGEEGVVLVAAKVSPYCQDSPKVSAGRLMSLQQVLYFGVGGGLQHFLHRVEEGGGWSSVVKEWMNGVGRKVVRIGW